MRKTPVLDECEGFLGDRLFGQRSRIVKTRRYYMAVDGTYEISIQTPMGTQPGKMVLKVEGDAVVGTMQNQMGTEPIQNGKANGDEFRFLVEAKTPMGPIKMTVKGKVEEDEVLGQAVTPFGPAPIKGKKV
jgi:hypothetical protein